MPGSQIVQINFGRTAPRERMEQEDLADRVESAFNEALSLSISGPTLENPKNPIQPLNPKPLNPDPGGVRSTKP